MDASTVIESLEKAKLYEMTKPGSFKPIYKQILLVIDNQINLKSVQLWGIQFIYENFFSNKELNYSQKVSLAVETLHTLHVYVSLPDQDVQTFRKLIEISSLTYKLIFQYVSENDGDKVTPTWNKLVELKNSLINQYTTTFPLEPSDNLEHDYFRNIGTKLQLLDFLMIVIDYQSNSAIIEEEIPGGLGFSLNNVPEQHSLIKRQNMEKEATLLLTHVVLKVFELDILITPLLTATINHLALLMKKKQQFAAAICKSIDLCNTDQKVMSNYQTVEQFKLAKKYVDRTVKVFIKHCKEKKLIPKQYEFGLNKIMSVLIERGNEVRKKNIFNIPEADVKKRKFEGFYNPSKKAKTLTYKGLYTLNDPEDKINSFDVSSLQPQLLQNLVINALQKASVSKLTKALEIISERYKNAILQPITKTQSPSALQNFLPAKPPVKDIDINQLAEEDDEEEEENDDLLNPESVFTLPPPDILSFQEKKDHLSIIIRNFIKKANESSGTDNKLNSFDDDDENDEEDETEINRKLKEVAIKSWNKDTWCLLLARLATRGLRTDGDQSPDERNKNEMAQMIREALFNHFVEHRGQVDLMIVWLTEEWHADIIHNEANKLQDKQNYNKEEDRNYFIWAKRILDNIISFLEPSDKKLFVRLVSDLPELDSAFIEKILSIVKIPGKSDIGILSATYLLQYRPPVKQMVLNELQKIYEGEEDEEIRPRIKNLLNKFIE